MEIRIEWCVQDYKKIQRNEYIVEIANEMMVHKSKYSLADSVDILVAVI